LGGEPFTETNAVFGIKHVAGDQSPLVPTRLSCGAT